MTAAPSEQVEDYRDIDGNPISLYRLVRQEPDWVASRIRVGRKDADRLARLEAVAEAAKTMRSAQPSLYLPDLDTALAALEMTS